MRNNFPLMIISCQGVCFLDFRKLVRSEKLILCEIGDWNDFMIYNFKVFCFYWTGFLDIFPDNLNETPLVKDYHEDYLDLNYFSSHFVVHRTKWYLVLVLLIWLQVIITKYIDQLQHDSILCKTKPEQLLILLIVTNHIF